MAGESKFLELIAVAVAGGSTIRHAAAQAGCSESHAYHLSRTPDFRRRVAERRTEATTAAVGKLASAATQAVTTLVELLDPANEPKDRLAAAKAILASLPALSEHGELRERLDELEQQNLRRVG